MNKLAEGGENVVIVGRCADYVLRDYYNNTDVFIHAPKDSRIKRIIEEYGISEKDAEKSLFDVDRARENYYKYHTGRKWGQPSNYHGIRPDDPFREEGRTEKGSAVPVTE